MSISRGDINNPIILTMNRVLYYFAASDAAQADNSLTLNNQEFLGLRLMIVIATRDARPGA